MSGLGALLSNNAAIVTVEFPDGRVLSGKANIVDVSLSTEVVPSRCFGEEESRQISGLTTWEVSLQGSGPLEMRGQYQERIEQQRAAPEWRCPYCGQVHPWARVKCWDGINGCGAPRPLALGEDRR